MWLNRKIMVVIGVVSLWLNQHDPAEFNTIINDDESISTKCRPCVDSFWHFR